MIAEKVQPMNIHQLVTNPTGKYSAYMSARHRIIDDLNNRYAKLISQHKGFKFGIFKKKDDYIFHFKIPSETVDGVMYDVVIMFVIPPDDNDAKMERTLKNYHVKLFSNSPNFTFTYTYVLNKSGILVPFMKKKCSDDALNQAPTVRNPVEVYGFEKSCYYACRYIQQNNLLVKFELDSNLKLFNEASFLAKIKSDTSKFAEYRNTKAKLAKDKKKKPVKKENGDTLKTHTKKVERKSNIKKAVQPKSVIKPRKKK